ncbi:MAG: DNA methyltransferase, partial [Anaerolineae bacterium]|nr:DNA methyltransferase [Anaerolineae bacterium]
MIERPEHHYVQIDPQTFLDALDRCLDENDLARMRGRVADVQSSIDGAPLSEIRDDGNALGDELSAASPLILRRDVLLGELQQVLDARTLRRARYYLARLQKGVTEVRTNAVNDINLNRWKEYDDILTDSLWLMDRRDNSGSHEASYWGNFIPQIPHQLMMRYTKAGEWVLDPFAGSGTTLIECKRLGRNGLGVELNAEVAARSSAVVAEEPNPYGVTAEVAVGDSGEADFGALLASYGVSEVQLVVLHPPYHDIIRFGDAPADLSNAPSIDAFVTRFGDVVRRARQVLGPGRFLAVVIGDKYEGRAWVPLGFYAMQAVMAQGLTLKSVVVKNLNGTRA